MTNMDTETRRPDHLDPRVRLTSQLETDGGDPTFLFTIIENMIERQDWLKLPASRHDSTPVGSFRRLMEADPPMGCGLPKDRLLKILDLPRRHERMDDDADPVHQQMEMLRVNVKRLLDEDVEPSKKHGGDRRSEQAKANKQDDSVNLKTTGGNDPEYILGRLKRDRPDLAERVESGELSAYAAGKLAGIKRPKTEVFLDDMGDAARKLVNKLSADQIDDLIAELQAYRG